MDTNKSAVDRIEALLKVVVENYQEKMTKGSHITVLSDHENHGVKNMAG
jgi:hypothetical protein